MKHTWEVSSVLAQVAKGRRGRKQGSSTAVEFQAAGISAWVGGAPPPSPAATASLLLWSVQVRGTRGFLRALEVACPGRQVRTSLFQKLGNSCEPALDFS